MEATTHPPAPGVRLNTSDYSDELEELTGNELLTQHSASIEAVCETFFYDAPNTRQHIETFVQNCSAIIDTYSKPEQDQLYQYYTRQIKELLDLLNNEDIDLELKKFAISHLTINLSPKLLLSGCEDSISTLNCRSCDEAWLVLNIRQEAEDRSEELFRAIAPPRASETDMAQWFSELLPAGQRRLQVYVQGRNSPLCMAKQYSINLIKGLESSTQTNSFFMEDLKTAIGETEYERLAAGAAEQNCCSTQEVTGRMLLSQTSHKELSLLIARHLFPGIPGVEQPIATIDHTPCKLMPDHSVLVYDHEADGKYREAVFSDLLNINLPLLEPHLRAGLLNFVYLSPPTSGEMAKFIVHYELDKTNFDDSEFYKYDIKRLLLNHFKGNKQAGDDSFEHWVAQATATELDMILPFLAEADIAHQRVFSERIKASGLPFPACLGHIPVGFIYLFGEDYIKASPLRQATIERFCAVDLKTMKLTKGQSESAQHVIAALLSGLTPEDGAKAVYIAAEAGNVTALRLLYKHLNCTAEIDAHAPPRFKGYNPAMIAAFKGRLEALQFILGRVDRDLLADDGKLFVAAARHPESDCLFYLLTQQSGAGLAELIQKRNSKFLTTIAANASPKSMSLLERAYPFDRLSTIDNELSQAWESSRYRRNDIRQVAHYRVCWSKTPITCPPHLDRSDEQLKVLTYRAKRDCLLDFIKNGRPEKVRLLLEIHKSETETIIRSIERSDLINTIMACGETRHEILLILAALGYTPVSEDDFELKLALKYGAADVVGYIVSKYKAQGKAGRLERFTADDGKTLMHLTVALNNIQLVRTLYKATPLLIRARYTPPGAKVAKKTNAVMQDTPLLTFVKTVKDKRCIELLNYLLQISGDDIFQPSATSKTQDDALMLMVRQNDCDTVVEFLDHYKKMPDTEQKAKSLLKAKNFLQAKGSKYQTLKTLFKIGALQVHPRGSSQDTNGVGVHLDDDQL